MRRDLDPVIRELHAMNKKATSETGGDLIASGLADHFRTYLGADTDDLHWYFLDGSNAEPVRARPDSEDPLGCLDAFAKAAAVHCGGHYTTHTDQHGHTTFEAEAVLGGTAVIFELLIWSYESPHRAAADLPGRVRHFQQNGTRQ